MTVEHYKKKVGRSTRMKLLGLIQKNPRINSGELRAKLGISMPVLSTHLKALESEKLIEHFDDSRDRRFRYYRIRDESKNQVQFLLDKQLLIDFISGIDYLDVLHFLQDFTMDLVSLRHQEDPERVDMKAIVKQATRSAFKLHDA
jgi:DNA-binding MarR family transcriptional regulator